MGETFPRRASGLLRMPADRLCYECAASTQRRPSGLAPERLLERQRRLGGGAGRLGRRLQDRVERLPLLDAQGLQNAKFTGFAQSRILAKRSDWKSLLES